MTFTQILLLAAAAVVAERAEPTGHFILLATQRTGSTWVMSELSKHSSCIATGTELFLDHKGFTWTQSSRARCLKMLYGSEIDKKKKPYKCSDKFKKFRSEVRDFAVLKIHSKRLNETVLNWNVVVKTLTGTEFERFLHDDA
jgi:hypothetical protein